MDRGTPGRLIPLLASNVAIRNCVKFGLMMSSSVTFVYCDKMTETEDYKKETATNNFIARERQIPPVS